MKRSKIKNREREFFMSTVYEKKARWIQKFIMKCKTDICFDKCNRRKYNMKTCK